MPDFYYEIAARFDSPLSDELVDAIEAACITEEEWQDDENDATQRVHGALEELTNGTF